MWAVLYTRSPNVSTPQDYVDLFLCRDIYHCTPDRLDNQSAVRVFRHLKLIEIEHQVEERKKPKVPKKNANL